MIPGKLRTFLLALTRRRSLERELEEELRFHLEMEAAKNERAGMGREEARRAALVAFGGVERHKEALRDGTGARWLENLVGDLRYTLRGLRRWPAFTLTAVLTLALGLGANATMFSIVDRLLFRPPPYLRDAATAHRLYFTLQYRGEPFTSGSAPYARFLDVKRDARSFSEVAAFSHPILAVGSGDAAQELPVGAVSADFFRIFDAAPAAGRWFTPAEDRPPSGGAVAVLSWGLWQARYGGRPGVLGSTLEVGSRRYTIVGVAPRGFAGLWPAEPPVLYIPISSYAAESSADLGLDGQTWWQTYHWSWVNMVARRRPEVSVAAADADLTRAFLASYRAGRVDSPSRPPPEEARPRAVAGSILSDRGPEETGVARVATWLGGVSLIVLLVACANVANLLLARAMRRRREIAVRLALGIGRRRLLSQLLTESVLLALLGGAGGLLVAFWGGRLLRASLLASTVAFPVLGDGRTLLFAGGAALAVGLLAGLAPALQTRGLRLTEDLAAGGRGGTPTRSRARAALLVFQAALSVVLLVGAGLFVRSLEKVRSVRLGYDADRVLVLDLHHRGARPDSAHSVALRDALLDRVQAIPGVTHASRTLSVPFTTEWNQPLHVAGIDSVGALGIFAYNTVSPDYFATMGTRIVRGRAFDPGDRDGAPAVMVVSQAMARVLWPGRDPLGQCVRVGEDTAPCTRVVGVAENTHTETLGDDATLYYYLPAAQAGPARGGLLVRTRGPAAGYAETVRRQLQAVMPGDAYVTVTPFSQIVSEQTRSWALGARMFLVFGLLALSLAAIGLYGVIAYAVAQRTRELGIRLALGARMADMLRLVVGEGLRVSGLGAVLGTVIALLAAPRIGPLLFDESPRDVFVYAGVFAVLMAVAGLASLVPALRGARVDPNEALRAE